MKYSYSIKRLLFVAIIMLAPSMAFGCPDIDGLVDVNCDRELVIVAFGNSITHGVGDEAVLGGYPGRLSALLPHATIYNYGVPGERTPTGRTRIKTVFGVIANADYTLILEGVNDYWISGYSPNSTLSNLTDMVHTAQRTGALTLLGTLAAVRRPNQKPWVSSVNSRIKPYTSIDYYSLGEQIIGGDLLHPNAAGYQQMATLSSLSLMRVSAANRPADTDGDGLYDYMETKLGSDLFTKDSDKDGLLDGEDYGSGGSPILVDSDNDGISDYNEVKVYGSNPGDARPGAPTIEKLEFIN